MPAWIGAGSGASLSAPAVAVPAPMPAAPAPMPAAPAPATGAAAGGFGSFGPFDAAAPGCAGSTAAAAVAEACAAGPARVPSRSHPPWPMTNRAHATAHNSARVTARVDGCIGLACIVVSVAGHRDGTASAARFPCGRCGCNRRPPRWSLLSCAAMQNTPPQSQPDRPPHLAAPSGAALVAVEQALALATELAPLLATADGLQRCYDTLVGLCVSEGMVARFASLRGRRLARLDWPAAVGSAPAGRSSRRRFVHWGC